MMTKVDFFGHWFYASLFLGMVLLHAKDYRGWIFRLAGEVGWIVLGFVTSLTSIWMWGFAFLAVDVMGYLKWQKEEKELALIDNGPVLPPLSRPMWNVEPNVNEPYYWTAKVQNDTPTFTEEDKNVKRKSVQGSKQASKKRSENSATTKAKRNPPVKRKAKRKAMAKKRGRAPHREIRPGRRRSSK